MSNGAVATDFSHAEYEIRKLTIEDLKEALTRGLADFWSKPSHLLFLSLIYPIAMILFVRVSFGYHLLPLLFPIASGFALLGPFVAVGLYDISRSRERGEEVTWKHAFGVFRPPTLGSIITLGVILVAIFVLWVVAAGTIYAKTLGVLGPSTPGEFFHLLFTTSAGWAMIIIGNAVGFVFSFISFTISVISFPMVLDTNVSPFKAIATSLKAVSANPLVMGVWGLIVATFLVIGMLPLFIGLAFVMPILGHATWHLYRKTIQH